MSSQVDQTNQVSQIKEEQYIELYPSNWLYNAGVVGFLSIIDSYDKKFNKNELSNTLKHGLNTSTINDLFNIFIDIQFTPEISEKIPFWHWEYIQQTTIINDNNLYDIVTEIFKKIYSNKNKKVNDNKNKEKILRQYSLRLNNTEINIKKIDEYINNFIKNNNDIKINEAVPQAISEIKNIIYYYRNIFIYIKTLYSLFSTNCDYKNYYSIQHINELNNFIKFFNSNKILNKQNENTDKCYFCQSTNFHAQKIDLKMFSYFFPNYNEFKNSYWGLNPNQTQNICSLCEFLLLHQHLGFTTLYDNTKIFINAPSFELMYALNKLIKELSIKDNLSKIKLLAMSLIEYSLKINSILSDWTLMNIELISIKNKHIDFINIPYNVIKLISNKKIASLLKEIGDVRVLNIVLNEKYSELVDLAYINIRKILKSDKGKDKNVEADSIIYSNNLLQLFALIKETIKNQ
jgi:hypothetical protein